MKKRERNRKLIEWMIRISTEGGDSLMQFLNRYGRFEKPVKYEGQPQGFKTSKVQFLKELDKYCKDTGDTRSGLIVWQIMRLSEIKNSYHRFVELAGRIDVRADRLFGGKLDDYSKRMKDFETYTIKVHKELNEIHRFFRPLEVPQMQDQCDYLKKIHKISVIVVDNRYTSIDVILGSHRLRLL